MFCHSLIMSTKWTKWLFYWILKYSFLLRQVHCRWLFSSKEFSEQPLRHRWMMWTPSVFFLQKAMRIPLESGCSWGFCRMCCPGLKHLICQPLQYCHCKQKSLKFKQIFASSPAQSLLPFQRPHVQTGSCVGAALKIPPGGRRRQQ